LPIAVVLAVSAGLLLAACGGGGSDGSDKIQPSAAGAPVTTTASATTASATPSATAAGPAAATFDLPSDAKVDFTGFDGSDTKTAPVLRDVENIVMTMQEAEGMGKGSTPNIKRYFSGVQAATISDTAINYRRAGLTITGTVRDYRPTVAFDAADRAQVSYCEDESKAYDKVIATGQVKKTTPSLKDFSLWRMGLVRNAAGDWQVVDYSQQKGVSKCAVS
jgi:hypothetical protein